jgi:hypothetical protein
MATRLCSWRSAEVSSPSRNREKPSAIGGLYPAERTAASSWFRYGPTASAAWWVLVSALSMEVPPAMRAALASASSSCLLEMACVDERYIWPYKRKGRRRSRVNQ